MLRKLYLTIIFITANILVYAQSGALKGTVTDQQTGEPIPFANVILELNGSQVGIAQTDFDGNYTIKPINPGKYDIRALILGYSTIQVKGVIIGGDKTEFYNIKLAAAVKVTDEVIIVDYKVPLISKDNTTTGASLSRDDIANAPVRDVASMAATTAGVTQTDNGKDLNIRGARSGGTVYYIDGVKVRGQRGVPQSGIEQIDVNTGGVPAQYGDFTGGLISITTRGPSKIHSGGVEVATSQYLDAFGYNLVGANASGPIYTRRGETQPALGYFTAAEFNYNKDNNPAATGSWKVKDGKLEELRKNPLAISPSGGALRNADFVTFSDLEKIKTNENNSLTELSLTGKLDYKPSTNTNLTLGGNFNYSKRYAFSRARILFNNDRHGERTDMTFRTSLRFYQKFGAAKEDNKAATTIKNAYYSILVDYTWNDVVQQDPEHKDNFFNYGYIGKFKTYKTKSFQVNATQDTLFLESNDLDTLVTFEPGGLNPNAENYTTQVFNYANSSGNTIRRLDDVNQYGGLRNGDNTGNNSLLFVNDLFLNTGTVFDGYTHLNNQQFRITALGSADVKEHAISFGLEYEQSIDRQYTLAPGGLWTRMRILANSHLTGLDKSNPHISTSGNFVMVDYDRLYSEAGQSEFDKNFRQSLGLAVNDKQFLDIDNYDPSAYKLSYFSAQELLNAGVNYSGYDYTGKEVDAKQDFNKFFTDTLKRPVGAFQPNYIAGFIQDKFTFRDLIFRVGVRIDRYDANQKVLKDKYLMYEAKTASDPDVAAALASAGLSRPSNIGDNYVVYVDAFESTNVIGYRDGDTWYDASGTKVLPTTLSQGSTTVNPWLVDPEGFKKKEVNPNIFKDYEPEINVMPRVSFSFPISDEALFFAHYDILTQRPTANESTINPWVYLQMAQSVAPNSNNIFNPDLKPTKTTDYELGYRQKISNSSAITLTGFYREVRGEIATRNVINAFPITYQTYDNRDFQTTKGLSASYDLRRTNNVTLKAAYTLQFASGTGSNANSSVNLGITDPEIRTPLPLNIDSRHQISISMDYRYAKGTDYNGPVLFDKKILEETGLNVVLSSQSGTPYTQRVAAIRTATLTSAKSVAVKGELNGARLPWNTRVDAKIDKNFEIKWTKKDGDKKSVYLNVYLVVQNVLDARNILAVYGYSGSPDDDAYLASETLPMTQAFIDQYSVRVANPYNYTSPRFIRLGATLNF